MGVFFSCLDIYELNSGWRGNTGTREIEKIATSWWGCFDERTTVTVREAVSPSEDGRARAGRGGLL